MGDRVIDFSDRPAYLSVNNSLLVIRFPRCASRSSGGRRGRRRAERRSATKGQRRWPLQFIHGGRWDEESGTLK